MINVFHISEDEKFIDSAIEIFDNLNDTIKSTFLCLSQKPLKFIHNKDKVSTFKDAKSIIETINESNPDIVFLHSRMMEYKYLCELNEKIKLVWISWGYDIYNLSPYRFMRKAIININIYKPYTLSYVRRNIPLIDIAKFIFSIGYYKDKKYAKKFYQRVDYLSTILPIEFDYLNDFCKKNNIKKFIFRYTRPIRQNVLDEISKPKAKNILLGNSASPTNNHIDILKILSKQKLGDRKIIIPLSYNNDPRYIKFLKNEILQLGLNNNVIYLEDFIPINDYKEILNSCEFAFFGHIRQQAMGNVIIMLRNNGKIFFYKDSIVYQQIIKDGYKVLTIEELKESNDLDSFNNIKIENSLIENKKSSYESYLLSLRKSILEIVNS